MLVWRDLGVWDHLRDQGAEDRLFRRSCKGKVVSRRIFASRNGADR